MRISGLCFTKSIIERIDSIVKTSPSTSRRELARRLCEEYGWRSSSGKLKEASCRKALARLDREGIISLPTIERKYAFQQVSTTETMVVPIINCDLPALGQIVVRPVQDTNESRIWRAIMDSYHYLGAGNLCGAQIRYLVECQKYGAIGGLAFTSASFTLKKRDEYIGWSPAASRENLCKVVCNARFVIANTAHVPNLASHVLAQALHRLPADWEARYAVRPVLVETFVDPSRFTGTCYEAANWREIGYTSGRRDGVKKRIYVRELDADWQEILCREPSLRLCELPRPDDPANWAEEEFGTVRLYDERLKRRLYQLAQDFYNNCEDTIPGACGNRARTAAAYRFFQNKAVNMEVILTPHTEATIERIKKHPVVLAPQDTTTLDYNTHTMTQGLGPTGTKGQGLGLLLHDTLAFTPEGTPLGVLDAQCWARDPADEYDGLVPAKNMEKCHFKCFIGYIDKSKLDIEDKESAKWLRSYRKVAAIQRLCPDTTLISIGDREADIWEVFREATKDPQGPRLLVRADGARNRKTGEQYLWDFMARQTVQAKLQIHIPHSGSRQARDAFVDLRYANVELQPPHRCASEPPIKLSAVYLVEDPPGKDVSEPIEWLLLTTAPVRTLEDAKTTVEWYSGRWGIEVYHRTLKSGCRIRDRQLGTADRLEACIGIDMVVAWRIYYLTLLGRETPDASCTVFFEDIEWKALCCYVTNNPTPPKEPPTLKEAVQMIGLLGGYMGPKNGLPGTQIMWRGLQRLELIVDTTKRFRFWDSNRSP